MKLRKMKKALMAVLVLTVMSFGAAAFAPAQERLGERIGSRLDELGQELREGWARARSTVEQMGVQGRVYGRIRWDKALTDAEIDVDMRGERTVVLRGTVPSETARKKAVELAGDTVGVERLVDELKVLSTQ